MYQSGSQHMEHADIAFFDMSKSVSSTRRVYDDTTHRNVVGMTASNQAVLHGSHARWRGVKVADAEKMQKCDEASLSTNREGP